MAILSPEDLLKLADAYGEATGLTRTGVGRRAVGNDKAFIRCAEGQGVHMRTAERAAQWFGKNWPENATWPDDVPGKPRTTVPAFTSRHAAREKIGTETNA
jgi:hypothetical protein